MHDALPPINSSEDEVHSYFLRVLGEKRYPSPQFFGRWSPMSIRIPIDDEATVSVVPSPLEMREVCISKAVLRAKGYEGWAHKLCVNVVYDKYEALPSGFVPAEGAVVIERIWLVSFYTRVFERGDSHLRVQWRYSEYPFGKSVPFSVRSV